MSLKGSAKIELINADGTKEVVEHRNMITNAVNDLMFAARGEQSNIMRIASRGDSFIEQLFGGILLFKHTLNDDPDDYYIPSVDTVGYANLGAYGGLDIERGGFNASESGLQEDGTYKLVWDFATSQANGTIKSIALCPHMMGRIGLSNSAVSSEQVSVTTARPLVAPFDINNRLHDNYNYNIVAVVGNIAYVIDKNNISCATASSDGLKTNGGVLRFMRYDVAENSVSVKSRVAYGRYIDTIDVQLPSEFISQLDTQLGAVNCSYDAVSKKISLYDGYKCTIGKNAARKYVEINIANGMSATLKTFTNNAPGVIQIYENFNNAFGDYGYYTPLYMTGDYIISVAMLDDKTRKMYVTKKSDNTDIKEVKYNNGNEFNLSGSTSTESSFYIRPVFTCGNLFVFGQSQGSQYTSFTAVYILDLTTGLMKKTNAKEMTYRSNIPLDNKVTWGKTGTYMGLAITVCPFVLTTKNNLDAPVTKTASQTMKITYTLTEV